MSEIKNAKEIAEQAKKIESAQKRVKEAVDKLRRDINIGRTEYIRGDSSDIKYAKEALSRAQNELDRLKR